MKTRWKFFNVFSSENFYKDRTLDALNDLLKDALTLAWCRSTPYMDSFLALSRNMRSAWAGLMDLWRDSSHDPTPAVTVEAEKDDEDSEHIRLRREVKGHCYHYGHDLLYDTLVEIYVY